MDDDPGRLVPGRVREKNLRSARRFGWRRRERL